MAAAAIMLAAGAAFRDTGHLAGCGRAAACADAAAPALGAVPASAVLSVPFRAVRAGRVGGLGRRPARDDRCRPAAAGAPAGVGCGPKSFDPLGAFPGAGSACAVRRSELVASAVGCSVRCTDAASWSTSRPGPGVQIEGLVDHGPARQLVPVHQGHRDAGLLPARLVRPMRCTYACSSSGICN